ncbi:DNA polymerase bacteriophage-type [Thermotomaculum hydrothermale]|uniref:Type-4 uracil-DNA glycosylase n=1 Tax=Thermotomaculum hydrothermale TaxID=981385 RepID=A0A7R6PM83_9BACT|nr:uracil-DNA glycosylase [Thermotomaculum hydrothermale]BBB32692.1 DNA polymerase bacteriophage-type [Thermotomaculum hydrothermale]
MDNEIIEYLKFLKDIGIDEIPRVKLTVSKPVNTEKKSVEEVLKQMAKEVANCKACPLSQKRQNSVLGEGNPHTDLMFIGEGPGADEDRQGRPFVGRAGQLLTKIINAMGLERSDVYISNVVKCRPPFNRDPEPEEIAACWHFIEKQIELIKPKVICTLGRISTKTILMTTESISRLRGRFGEYKGIKVMPTFHPSYLLRNPSAKKQVWEDMQKIMHYLAEHSETLGEKIKKKLEEYNGKN